MIDDPHDETWVPHNRKVVWCPVCQDDAETCDCYRSDVNGTIIVLLLSGIAAVCLIVGIILMIIK